MKNIKETRQKIARRLKAYMAQVIEVPELSTSERIEKMEKFIDKVMKEEK